jgi:hypothetical protein
MEAILSLRCLALLALDDRHVIAIVTFHLIYPPAMNQRFEALELPFSTADASRPEIVYSDGTLRIQFVDWQRNLVCLSFEDAVSFSWEDSEVGLDTQHRDDCSYVVDQSRWLERHLNVSAVTKGEPHRHFKLCFNELGILQVIAAKVERLP